MPPSPRCARPSTTCLVCAVTSRPRPRSRTSPTARSRRMAASTSSATTPASSPAAQSSATAISTSGNSRSATGSGPSTSISGASSTASASSPRFMLAQDEPGHIVNTASTAGLTTGGTLGVYGVSKHGVVRLSEALYFHLRDAGAQVGTSVLCPGGVRTRIAAAGRNRPDDRLEADILRLDADETAKRASDWAPASATPARTPRRSRRRSSSRSTTTSSTSSPTRPRTRTSESASTTSSRDATPRSRRRGCAADHPRPAAVDRSSVRATADMLPRSHAVIGEDRCKSGAVPQL